MPATFPFILCFHPLHCITLWCKPSVLYRPHLNGLYFSATWNCTFSGVKLISNDPCIFYYILSDHAYCMYICIDCIHFLFSFSPPSKLYIFSGGPTLIQECLFILVFRLWSSTAFQNPPHCAIHHHHAHCILLFSVLRVSLLHHLHHQILERQTNDCSLLQKRCNFSPKPCHVPILPLQAHLMMPEMQFVFFQRKRHPELKQQERC